MFKRIFRRERLDPYKKGDRTKAAMEEYESPVGSCQFHCPEKRDQKGECKFYPSDFLVDSCNGQLWVMGSLCRIFITEALHEMPVYRTPVITYD